MSPDPLSLTRLKGVLDFSPIERCADLSLEEFDARFRGPARPVVITNGVAEWRALTEWTFDRLRDRHGAHRVSVYFARGGPYLDNLSSSAPRTMTVAEYLALIADQPDCRVYLGESSILEEIDELVADAPPPRYAPRDRFITRRFWLGPANTLTAIHKDSLVGLPISTLFAQVRGRKHFVLASPQQTPFLYPSPADPSASLVDPEKVDLEQFPLLREASFHETVLAPGDLLLIPRDFWHLAQALEPGISISNDWVESELVDLVTRLMKAPDRQALLQAYAGSITCEHVDGGFPGGVDGIAVAFGKLPEELRPLVARLFAEDLRAALGPAGGI
jgi:histone arginine demethylase JMJD6